MKSMKFLTLFQIFCFACIAQPRNVSIDTLDGGLMVTKSVPGDAIVNKGSALKRIFVVVNDATCPVKLSGWGIGSIFFTGGPVFNIAGSATAVESISAVEVVSVLYDLWGSHMENVSMLAITEISKGAELPKDDRWNASRGDVARFMISISYVKRVRTPDGNVWKSDSAAILEKLVASIPMRMMPEDFEFLPPPSSKK